MHAVKRVARKWGLDLYGTKYDIQEFLSKFDEIPGYMAIVQYNGTHFLNVTGVVRDIDGKITHVIVTNGYIGGVEQTREITIEEFMEYYEGKLLSTEKSDYDKRLTDDQLQNIRGAGWLDDIFDWFKDLFDSIVKVIKKVIQYIIEPFVQLVKAIKFAIEEGEWGRVLGAIGILVAGAVISIFAPEFAYTIMNTAVSMATAICYGQYTMALKSLALGYASMVFQGLLNWASKAWTAGTNFLKTSVENIKNGIIKATEGITKVFEGVLSVFNKIVDSVMGVYESIVETFRGWGDLIQGTNPADFFRWNVGGAFRNIVGGMITSGISRAVAEEMDETSNWLGKLGLAFAGTIASLPFQAFGSFGFAREYSIVNDQIQMGSDWLVSANATTHMMLELGIDSVSSVISNETYKVLEDELGEEWYADLLRNSINSVIGAGFDIIKQTLHTSLWINDTLREISQKHDGITPQQEYLPDGQVKLTYTDQLNQKQTIVIYNNDDIQVFEMDIVEGLQDISQEGDGWTINADLVEKLDNGYRVTYGQGTDNETVEYYDDNLNMIKKEVYSSYFFDTETYFTEFYNAYTHAVVDISFDGNWLEYYYGDEIGNLWDQLTIENGQIKASNLRQILDDNQYEGEISELARYQYEVEGLINK
ncbi:MAG: hypothetical protein DRI61_15655, partial [Chloroflexi bacterium]